MLKQIGKNLVSPFILNKKRPSSEQLAEALNRLNRRQQGVMNSADLAREIAKPLSLQEQAYLASISPETGENHLAKLSSRFPSLSTVKEYKKAIESLKFELEAGEKLYTHLIDGKTEISEAAFSTLQSTGQLKEQIAQYEFDSKMMTISNGVKANLDLAKLYADREAEALKPRNLADRPDRLLEDLTVSEEVQSEENLDSVDSKSKVSIKDFVDLAKNILNVIDDSPLLSMLTLALTIKLLFFFDVNLIDNSKQTTVNPAPVLEETESNNVYNFIFLTLEDFNNKRENNYDFGENIPFVFESDFSISYANHVERQVTPCIESALLSLPANAVPTHISVNNLALTELHFIIEDDEGELEDFVPFTGYQFECLDINY
ncbi:hypothetical protein CL656_01970 [bacterium]|nr:hypothetical protein [bacterium]|tara:strand:- start:2684 stop:3808 length:1125 start_codon:yes stop_codon:yes gene_type:complete